MTRVIADTGPLVALLNSRETHHLWVRETMDSFAVPFLTCEAVLAEACFLMRQIKGGADAVLELAARGILSVDFCLASEMASVRRLMDKYVDVPMSLADACLVRMTELDSRTSVLTLDGDFRVYRRNGRQAVPVIMPG